MRSRWQSQCIIITIITITRRKRWKRWTKRCNVNCKYGPLIGAIFLSETYFSSSAAAAPKSVMYTCRVGRPQRRRATPATTFFNGSARRKWPHSGAPVDRDALLRTARGGTIYPTTSAASTVRSTAGSRRSTRARSQRIPPKIVFSSHASKHTEPRFESKVDFRCGSFTT